MILTDVNVLIYAFREDSPDHAAYRSWLVSQFARHEPFGLSDLVLSGVVRIVTHPKIFAMPTPTPLALQYVSALRSQRNAVLLQPGPRHWEIFTALCESAGVKGNLVPDAYHAALALENGCEWITTDRDFARFRELRWRHPLESLVTLK